MVLSKNWNHHLFIYGILLIGHHPLKENYALNEANDTKLAQQYGKNQVNDLQERMEKQS